MISAPAKLKVARERCEPRERLSVNCVTDPRVSHLAGLTGLTFARLDDENGRFVDGAESELGWSVPETVRQELGVQFGVDLCEADDLLYYIVRTDLGAWGGFLTPNPDRPPSDLVMAAVAAGWAAETWYDWLHRVGRCDAKMLRRFLNLAWAQIGQFQAAEQAEKDAQHLQNLTLLQEQEDLLVAFVRSLVTTIDAKDHYTRGHSERVAKVARRIAKQMGLDELEQDAIHLSGLLHDIGKIGVEDAILTKRNPLTPEEFRKVQEHPAMGWQILAGLKQLNHILPGVRSHHENFGGSGYPDRLAGEEIPLMARIMAVADAYDAMASDRPYRNGLPLTHLEEVFAKGAGCQWDPEIIRAYFSCRDEIRRLWMTAF